MSLFKILTFEDRIDQLEEDARELASEMSGRRERLSQELDEVKASQDRLNTLLGA